MVRYIAPTRDTRSLGETSTTTFRICEPLKCSGIPCGNPVWGTGIQVKLQRHPIPPGRHGKSQEAAHRQARANDSKRVEGKEERGTPQLVEAQVEKTEVMGATDRQSP